MSHQAAQQLAQAHQALGRQQAELDAAQARIVELTEELDATNRGIIALHSELDAAHSDEARAWAEHEVMAERDRIARDLHDQVIQRVFAAGLALQGIASLIRNPRAAKRVRAVIDDLDATVHELRTAIFGAYDPPRKTAGLHAQFTDLIIQADDQLGFSPSFSFQGPTNAAVRDHIIADVLAVAREALSNIARHAHATTADIILSATDDEIILRVTDNGRGLSPTTGTSGLRDMRERAQALGGSFHATGSPDAGTQLEWRVPLPRRDESGPDH